jgi:hypothetical protein
MSIRQMQQHQTSEELEIMMASAPPTTLGNDSGERDLIPMKQKPLVLSRSNSQSERLLLIRTLQGYTKTTSSPRRAEQDDDNKSVQSVRSTKSWWRGGGGRSARVDDDVKSAIPDNYARSSSGSGGHRQRSLRWKRKKNTPRKPSNDKPVVDLDFFDVKSVASEPEFVGSKIFQLYPQHKTSKLLNHHETRSVSSSRSFPGFSLHFQQAGIDDDDDELTMASGLAEDFISAAEDGASVVSGVTLEPPRFLQRAVSEGGNLASSHKKRSSKKPSFLRRVYRKIRRSRGTSTSHPTPAEANRQITNEIQVVTNSSAPEDNDEEEEVVLATTGPPSSLERFDTADTRSRLADRWSPIPQYDEVIPQAPKPPKRVSSGSPPKRVSRGNHTFQPILEDESKQEEKEGDDCEDDEDDDDDSVISLLSGLLATWTSERDAHQQVQQRRAGAAPSHGGPKSCLKASRSPLTFKPRFSVSFDRIKIREYERTLGDNPSCTSGPPISIGWTCLHSYDYPIDEYERNKTVRRTRREFRLPAGHRTDLLMQEWQCPEDDIRKACREATYVQYCREKAVLSRARQREREAVAMRSNRLGPRPDTSDTTQPAPAQLRHRSSIEIGLESFTRSRV